jgi:hypothetical protein
MILQILETGQESVDLSHRVLETQAQSRWLT